MKTSLNVLGLNNQSYTQIKLKKIDLHIHTKSSISDAAFEFSLASLQGYVTKSEIDCIAITNHNLFDLRQFEEIRSNLRIKVFPGIEINLESGHLLLISDIVALEEFEIQCNMVEAEIVNKNDSISVETFKIIFPDLSKYLLIPHSDKNPIISKETINKLSPHIYAGEVTSPSKFKMCIQDVTKLTPVIFSDVRIIENMSPYPTKATFVDIGDLTLMGLKFCLRDKTKVFLSKDDGNERFQATDDGLYLSTGLNVILGERSSGKSYTLNKIKSAFTDNIKYIEQFALLQNDEEKFKTLMSNRNSDVSERFLKEFKHVVDDVINIDYTANKSEIGQYLDSLIRYASDSHKHDSFSRARLFDEVQFSISELKGLSDLIEATAKLIDNTSYSQIIVKHLNIENLKKLICELIENYIDSYELNLKRNWVNELVNKIKDDLKLKTTIVPPNEIDLYNSIWENYKVKKFIKIVDEIRKEREIERKEFGSFKVVVSTKKFTGAQRMKTISKTQLTFTEAFNKYNGPGSFLKALKETGLPPTEIHKFFVDIDYITLNRDNFSVSGGERSEFNLLHEIKDAMRYEMLLIDEPESSFDNLFLKSEVNKLLKDISAHIPVILVTHNSTVGASISPDYIVYTRKSVSQSVVKYQVFSGYPSDKQLKCVDGEVVDNYGVMMACLEAGEQPYEERNKTYGLLKN
ncbi:MAG: hypothetical protein JWP71_3411 [Mucilaginibacter sp.]|nr:hypothetical protein [Mucilaginibacter sp.]